MPFTKIKTGKEKGKYRSPSGRIFNAAQVRRYYARGGTFDCASPPARKPVGDARSPRTTDPTGTLYIRKTLNRAFGHSWSLIKQQVRSTVAKEDSFGLSQYGPGQLAAMAATGGQVHAFSIWLDSAQSRVLVGLHGAIEKAVGAGYVFGRYHAEAKTGKTLLEPLAGSSVVVASAVQDLEGIAQAVLQQATRVFSQALLSKAKPQPLARAINMIIDKIGVRRSSQLASYAVVRAHANGTLDTLLVSDELASFQRLCRRAL